MQRWMKVLLVAAAMTLGCGGDLDPQDVGSGAEASMSVQKAPLAHGKCPGGTVKCGKVCCDVADGVACVNGGCCVPPRCP